MLVNNNNNKILTVQPENRPVRTAKIKVALAIFCTLGLAFAMYNQIFSSSSSPMPSIPAHTQFSCKGLPADICQAMFDQALKFGN